MGQGEFEVAKTKREGLRLGARDLSKGSGGTFERASAKTSLDNDLSMVD